MAVHHVPSVMRRLLLLIVPVLLVLVTWTGRANAYPWMIRHEYSGCTPCHADPSGGGLLTAYGRAQSALLLETQWKRVSEEQEPPRSTGFLWGAWQPPEWLLIGGFSRTALLHSRWPGHTDTRTLGMQYDLAAGLRTGALRAAASIGYVPRNGQAIAVTTNGNDANLVSREHWIGFAFGDESGLLRAGRMNLPFGIRNIEHTTWVRNSTRTDINDAQQHGIAAAWSSEHFRTEAMVILGNYQINPDRYRERGYAGFFELLVSRRAAVGVSSLITHSSRDRFLRVALTRHAHGIFTRFSPWKPLALLAEADAVILSLPGETRAGYAGILQADYEPIQGVHVIGTGETLHTGAEGSAASWGGWLSAAWFFLPHVDVRLDAIVQRFPSNRGPDLTVRSYLAQLHAWL